MPVDLPLVWGWLELQAVLGACADGWTCPLFEGW